MNPKVSIVRQVNPEKGSVRFCYVITGWKRYVEPSGFYFRSEAAALKAGTDHVGSLVVWNEARKAAAS